MDKNSAAYIPASNVMRDGNEYVLKITKASLNKMLSPKEGSVIPVESIVVMDNIERIANNGVYFDSKGDRDGRSQIAGFDYLKTTVYIDGAPYEVKMRVRLVEEVPGKGADNVLYYFTPEEIVTIERVGTQSPTDERRALIVGSETMPTPEASIPQTAQDVNSELAQKKGKSGYVSPDPLVRAMMGQGTGEITSAGVETPVNVDAATDSGYNDPIRMEGGRTDGIQQGAQLDGAAGEGVFRRSAESTIGRAFSVTGSDGQGDISALGRLGLSEDKAGYSLRLDEARAADPINGWAVTPKTAEELAQCKTFISEDGGVGFAIAPDGDIEAVFRNKVRHPQGKVMRTALPQAIAEGGTKLDCYGEGLVNLYAQNGGFEPVARVAFNPEFANPGWTADKGTPDIYVMMATDIDPDVVRSKQGSYKLWTDAELAALPLMEYDEAMAYRDRLLTEQLSSKGGSPEIGDGAPNSVGAAAEGQTATQYVDTLVADIRSRSAEQTASQPIDPLIADIRSRAAGQTASQPVDPLVADIRARGAGQTDTDATALQAAQPLSENMDLQSSEAGDTINDIKTLWGGSECEGEERTESRQEFRQRSAGEGITIFEGSSADYGYKRMEGTSQRSGEIREELKKLGIKADITDGTVWRNQDGISSKRVISEAATVGGRES